MWLSMCESHSFSNRDVGPWEPCHSLGPSPHCTWQSWLPVCEKLPTCRRQTRHSSSGEEGVMSCMPSWCWHEISTVFYCLWRSMWHTVGRGEDVEAWLQPPEMWRRARGCSFCSLLVVEYITDSPTGGYHDSMCEFLWQIARPHGHANS